MAKKPAAAPKAVDSPVAPAEDEKPEASAVEAQADGEAAVEGKDVGDSAIVGTGEAAEGAFAPLPPVESNDGLRVSVTIDNAQANRGERLAEIREALLQGSPEDLADLKQVLNSLPAGVFVPMEPAERRGFSVSTDLLHDGELYTPNGDKLCWLTQAQHEHLRGTNTVAAEWDEGRIVDA